MFPDKSARRRAVPACRQSAQSLHAAPPARTPGPCANSGRETEIPLDAASATPPDTGCDACSARRVQTGPPCRGPPASDPRASEDRRKQPRHTAAGCDPDPGLPSASPACRRHRARAAMPSRMCAHGPRADSPSATAQAAPDSRIPATDRCSPCCHRFYEFGEFGDIAHLVRLAAQPKSSVALVMRMVLVLVELVVQVSGIDGDLHHVEFVPAGIQHEKPHARALGMHEDQGLRFAVAAGVRTTPFPFGSKLLLHHAIQLFAVHRLRKVVELRHVHIADPALRGSPRNHADQAHEGNAGGPHVVFQLEASHHAIEPAFAAAGQNGHRDEQRHKTHQHKYQPSHSPPPFLTGFRSFCKSPHELSPPSPLSLPRSSMRMGPRINTIVSSLGSASSTKIPWLSPFTSFTITSVVS